MVEKDFFFFHFSYRKTIRSNLMNVKNALWIKLSLLVLSVMFGLCLVMGLSFTTAKADQPTNQVTIKQWDVSKNQDGSLTATLFTSATQSGLYDLVIQGSGEMYNWNQTSDKAFWYTEGYDLASVTLNEGLTSIGTNAFWNCRDLTSIDIPSTVKNIYSCAFWGATSLTTVTGGENVEHVKLGAFHLSPITSYPFETSTKLKTIEYQAFEYTNLSRVVLPQSLKQVWYNAFRGCENLTEVIVKGAKTTFLADINGVYNAFIDCNKDLVVKAHLSTNAHEAYPDLFQSLCEYDNCLDLYCNVCEAPGYGGAHEGEWQITLAPTTSSGGELKRACLLNPAHVETVILPALNSTDYVYTLIEEPTANEHGLASYTYEIDGFSFSFNVDVSLVREGLLDKAIFNDAVFGVVLGAVVVVAVLTFGIFWFVLKRRH